MPIPIKGDRSAFDDLNYPELHSADLEAGTPVHHMPEDATEGQTVVWRTDHWDAETPQDAQDVPISEDLTSQVDGEEVTFALSQAFVAGSTRVYINGLVQASLAGYTENAEDGEITFTTAPSNKGFVDIVLVDYVPA